MGQVISLFARKVIAEVDSDVDKDAALRSIGLEPGGPIDRSHMISATEYYALLERLAALDKNGTTIPLRAGAAMRCGDYGAFGLAWKSAISLRGSYERAERYARVLTSVATYQLEKASGGMFLHLHRTGERRLGMRLSNEATIASIAAISREVSTMPFTPLAVHFKHPAPESLVDHETYFGCPLHFASDRDALLVSNEMLQMPNKLGDESISSFFETHLEGEVAKLTNDSSLDKRVQNQVSKSLSEGVPTISDVAGRLGLSARTLQRQLSKRGHSYQLLVDESRRQLAAHLLRQTNYSLAEIAFMTGFSEQSAFTRAFKRWEGQTPRSFRIRSQSSPK